LGIASAFAAVLAAGMALGWWLDGVFGTSPILVLLGIALGLLGGVCYTVVQFRSLLATSAISATSADSADSPDGSASN
jgi:F0F1-type ATP synthase assembly protein I